MTPVGVFGLYLSTLAFFFAPLERTPNRIFLLFITWILHLVATVAYYYHLKTHPADPLLYYYDPYNFYEHGFTLGTWWVIFIVQFLKRLVGGTFFDYFLLFQAIGFWGLAVLMRTIEEIYARFRVEPPNAIFLICWLPGLHFWTSMIGKDAPLFLASSLAVWGVMEPRRRWMALAFSFGIMLLFRAHIALVAAVAIAGATFLHKRKTIIQWLALGALFGGVIIAVLMVKRSIYVDVTSVQSVSDFVATRSVINREMSGGSAFIGPFYLRLLSLLFRPFFFDVDELFGIISSMENLVMIFLIGVLIFNWNLRKSLSTQIFALRFWWLFLIGVILVLTILYYNVGLGLRQRTMFMPALIATFAAIMAVRKGRAAAAAQQQGPPSGALSHARI